MKLRSLLLALIAPLPLLAQQVKEAPANAPVEIAVDKVDYSKLKHPIRPMLWKASKAGVTGSVYLFGTIHLADKNITTLNPVAERAFVQSDRVYTEVDLSGRLDHKAIKAVTRKDNTTLTASIGKQMEKQLNAELKAMSPDFEVKFFDFFNTGLFAISLPQLENQLKNQGLALDHCLWERAENAQKTVKPLETFEEQSRGMFTLTEAEQRSMLGDSINYLKQARLKEKDGLKEIRQAYMEGDSKVLEVLFDYNPKETSLPKEFHTKMTKVLLLDRNERITANIQKELTQHPKKNHFFAVGVGHYLGKGSILELLKKKGYTITRVKQKQRIK